MIDRSAIVESLIDQGVILEDGCGLFVAAGCASEVIAAALNVAQLAATAERKKHQADIELWKGEAAKAEKWRAMALAKDPMHPGKAVQLIQCEAAAYEREACAQVVEAKEKSIYLYTNTTYLSECSAAIRARGNTTN